MKNIPTFLSSLFLKTNVVITIIDARIAYKPVINAKLPEIKFGKSKLPMLIETVASTIQLPIISPIASSYSFLRIAVKSTISSGKEVPIETMKKLMKNSDTLKTDDSLITD